jgi:NitT/TauT family transport system substrate-binding protein
MNIKRITMLVVLICLAVLTITSCRKDTQSETSNELVIYVPSAPPAIPLYKSAEELKNITIRKYTDVASGALPALLKGEKALFVLPTNVAATLYNKTGEIVLLNVLSSGLVQLLSSDPELIQLTDLNGKTIHIPAPGSSPDVIGRYILKKQNVSVEIEYGSAPEIAKLMIAGKVTNAILPEPLASAILFQNKSGTIQKVSDLRQQWISIHPETNGIPQVGICGNVDFIVERLEDITLLLTSLDNSVEWTNNNYDEAAKIGKEKIELEIPEGVIAESIAAMNLTSKSAQESKKDLEIYFEALYSMDPKTIGGKKPEDSFYGF